MAACISIWGMPKTLDLCVGMFAIALYDRGAEKMILVRDHVGIKPLYYATARGKLVWGSEIKALLATGLIERNIDSTALNEFLTWEYVPAPRTLFRLRSPSLTVGPIARQQLAFQPDPAPSS